MWFLLMECEWNQMKINQWMEALAPQQLLSLLHQRQLFVFEEERRKRVGCSAWPPAAHSLHSFTNQTSFLCSFISLNCGASEPELISLHSFNFLFAASAGPHSLHSQIEFLFLSLKEKEWLIWWKEELLPSLKSFTLQITAWKVMCLTASSPTNQSLPFPLSLSLRAG